MRRTLRRLLKDDRGGQILEYAMILALIVVACMVAIQSTGCKLQSRWNNVSSSL